MAFLEIFLPLLPILLYLFYKWSIKNFKVFEERGVAFNKPWPLIGNSMPFLKNQTSLHKYMLNLYRENKKHKIFGFYNFRDAFFIVNDPELIKKLAVKDFDSFANHQRIFNIDSEPIFSGMLTVMKDQRWKNMRNTVTPAFTGAKMRAMFTLMNDCFQEAMQYLHAKLEPGNQSFEIEMKDAFYRLSNNLIATTAFGLKVNAFENEKNEFYTIGRTMSKARGLQAVKFILFSIAPSIFKLLRIKVIDPDMTNYFVKLVVEAMKYREEHNIIRPDMIQLLMEAKRESQHQWSESDIVAQCFIFFFAAFENNATLLSVICYELAHNQNVQQRLLDEILDTDEKLEGKTLDYDNLQHMKYLDMVVQETLRKWTIAALTDRECGKDYKVYDDDGQFICELKEGDKIWFQIVGLHYDEQYFEQPEIFDPERFSDENKQKIKPFTYLPFGVGPRICIGNRYALMQAKAMIYYLLKDFKIERSEKLSKNLMDDLRGFSLDLKDGFWFKFSKR